jgi:tRNA-splicing ligase RtcB
MFQVINGIPVWGQHDPNTIEQIKNCHKDADHAALMADGHLGYAVPIGGVVAYEDRVSPSGVGYDIACGNKAVLLDAPAAEVRANIKTIMDDVFRTISFGVGRQNAERVDHELFDDPLWADEPYRVLKADAAARLGTVGSRTPASSFGVPTSTRLRSATSASRKCSVTTPSPSGCCTP